MGKESQINGDDDQSNQYKKIASDAESGEEDLSEKGTNQNDQETAQKGEENVNSKSDKSDEESTNKNEVVEEKDA